MQACNIFCLASLCMCAGARVYACMCVYGCHFCKLQWAAGLAAPVSPCGLEKRMLDICFVIQMPNVSPAKQLPPVTELYRTLSLSLSFRMFTHFYLSHWIYLYPHKFSLSLSFGLSSLSSLKYFCNPFFLHSLFFALCSSWFLLSSLV